MESFKSKIFGYACFVATVLSVLALAFMLITILFKGYDRLSPTLLTRIQTAFPDRAGIQLGLVGSLWLISLTALFAVPIGVGAAIYLEEYAPKNSVHTRHSNQHLESRWHSFCGVRHFGLRTVCTRFGVGSERSFWSAHVVAGRTSDHHSLGARSFACGSLVNAECLVCTWSKPLANHLVPSPTCRNAVDHDRHHPGPLARDRRGSPVVGCRGGRHSDVPPSKIVRRVQRLARADFHHEP